MQYLRKINYKEDLQIFDNHIKNNYLILTNEETHYINNVMRIKTGKEIFIANGKGSLWKAIKVKNDFLEIILNISKEKKKNMLHTKEEKYAYIINKNQNIKVLKDKLDLTII